MTWELLFFLLNVGECGGKYVEIGQRVFLSGHPLSGSIRLGDHQSALGSPILFCISDHFLCSSTKKMPPNKTKWCNCGGKACHFLCPQKLSTYNILKATNKDICNWFVAHGICRAVDCKKCGIGCKLSERESRAGGVLDRLVVWRCTLNGCPFKGRCLTACNGIMSGFQLPHRRFMQIVHDIVHGRAQNAIALELNVSDKTVHKVLLKVFDIVQWANDHDYYNSKESFVHAQVDETVVSKRKYNADKRTRQGGTEWIQVEVDVSPGKKSRKVRFFCIFLVNYWAIIYVLSGVCSIRA